MKTNKSSFLDPAKKFKVPSGYFESFGESLEAKIGRSEQPLSRYSRVLNWSAGLTVVVIVVMIFWQWEFAAPQSQANELRETEIVALLEEGEIESDWLMAYTLIDESESFGLRSPEEEVLLEEIELEDILEYSF